MASHDQSGHMEAKMLRSKPQPLPKEPAPIPRAVTHPGALPLLEGMDALMDPRTCAAYLGVSVLTLADHRTKGVGSPYIKVGSAVRYRMSAVNAWLEANTKLGA